MCVRVENDQYAPWINRLGFGECTEKRTIYSNVRKANSSASDLAERQKLESLSIRFLPLRRRRRLLHINIIGFFVLVICVVFRSFSFSLFLPSICFFSLLSLQQNQCCEDDSQENLTVNMQKIWIINCVSDLPAKNCQRKNHGRKKSKIHHLTYSHSSGLIRAWPQLLVVCLTRCTHNSEIREYRCISLANRNDGIFNETRSLA